MPHTILGRRKAHKTEERPVIPLEKPPVAQPLVTQPKPTRPPLNTEQGVTVIIVNFKTKQLTRNAYQSLRQHYPSIDVILIDNGSGDDSTEYIKSVIDAEKLLNKKNIGHGPAMHQAIQTIKTPYFFTLDSDCIVNKGGFIQAMRTELEEGDMYATGWLRWVDRETGVPLEWHVSKPPSENFVAYCHPAASLYRTDVYKTLKPFYHHGAPCLQNMVDAENKGYKVSNYPIFDYITHLVAGTRRMYKGRWDPKAGDTAGIWKKKDNYPI